MMSISRIVQIVIQLLVFGAIVGILYWIITIVPIPAPWQRWTLVALQVLAGLGVIGMLLDWAGYPIIKRNPPSA